MQDNKQWKVGIAAWQHCDVLIVCLARVHKLFKEVLVGEGGGE